MEIDKEEERRVLAQIDRDELAQLGCDLTTIPSPTGQEKAIAEFILHWFETNGIRAVRQDVEFDRPNAVGIVKGDGTGLSLGFNGHTDTSLTGTEEDRRMVANMEPEPELKGKIVDGKVQGLGISNMKGGVAAFMIAGKALKKSGIKLKGDVVLAAVVGEISRTPVGPWQTKEYRGEGAGTRHLLTHRMHPPHPPPGSALPEGKYRRHRGRRALPAQLLSRRLYDLRRRAHAAAGAPGADST